MKKYFAKTMEDKLFLCSRDIQVGDKYFLEGDEPYEFERKEDTTEFSLIYAYKVIGEISKDALEYVKEGDEFDEDEVKVFKEADKYSSKLITELMGEKWEHEGLNILIPGTVIFVKIKCPHCKNWC